MKSHVDELVDKIITNLSVSPESFRKLKSLLDTTISSVSHAMLISNAGYCSSFPPLRPTFIKSLHDVLGVTASDIAQAYKQDRVWGEASVKNAMHGDIIYQTLLLIVLYGIKTSNNLDMDASIDSIHGKALFLILSKIWNGRKYKYIKFCNPEIMDSAIRKMDNKYLVTKYSSPLSLMTDYFVPTLLKTYSKRIKKNPDDLKTLFQQAYSRINQIFVSNARYDLKAGRIYYQSGLLPKYLEAKEEQERVGSIKVRGSEDEEPTFGDYATTHVRLDISEKTANYIVMNAYPSYDQRVITVINKATKLKKDSIEAILKALHNNKFYDDIKEATVLILSRTNVNQERDVCAPDYFDKVKRTVISSKNNPEINNLKALIDDIATRIFKDHFKANYNSYNAVQKMQIRSVIIYGIVFNMRGVTCGQKLSLNTLTFRSFLR